MSSMQFELPKLEYGYKDLEPVIDEQTMTIHHTKHHQAYVDNLNKAIEEVGDKVGSWTVEQLVKGFDSLELDSFLKMKIRNNAGGHMNHSLFWKWMVPGGKRADIEAKVDKEKFLEVALGRFGSGWVWVMPDFSIISTSNQDNPIMDSKPMPILGLDVWEHAYYLKYQNRRKDYVQAWWSVVNWEEVEKGLKS